MRFRGVQIRLFLTCWLIFAIHFSTDFVREHYLVISVVEDHSFDLQKYLGLHPDIFRNPPTAGQPGVHHGANPGVSLIAALTYAPLRPAVDWIVRRELASRDAGDTLAIYKSETRPRRLEFYRTTRRLGLDVRFGLVAMITAVLCMAPLTAASVVAVFRILIGAGLGQLASLGLSFAYAFATPTFFRASYLNQNLAVAIFSISAFLLLWNPGNSIRLRPSSRFFLAGLLGGACVLCDYSGGLSLAVLGVYLLWREWQDASMREAWRAALWYGAGAIPAILILWFYQWQSFGNAFLPPQHWMPPIEWSNVGYQGVGTPKLDLFGLLLFDPRYGLFPSAPLLALAVVSPILAWRRRSFLPMRELLVCYVIAVSYVLFFSGVQYTRLEWVTGFRYLMPIVPFLFLTAVVTLLRAPRVVAFAVVAVAFFVTWSMTMVRSQAGILDSVIHTFVGGIRLPALTTFARLSPQYAPWLSGDASPLVTLLLTAGAVFAIWGVRHPWAPLLQSSEQPPAATDAAS